MVMRKVVLCMYTLVSGKGEIERVNDFCIFYVKRGGISNAPTYSKKRLDRCLSFFPDHFLVRSTAVPRR